MGLITSNTKIKITVKEKQKKNISFEENDDHALIFDPEWSFRDMGIGGLDAEFGMLFRRAFASRLFPAQLIQQLGIKHVKGLFDSSSFFLFLPLMFFRFARYVIAWSSWNGQNINCSSDWKIVERKRAKSH
jgi:hypothetical protein